MAAGVLGASNCQVEGLRGGSQLEHCWPLEGSRDNHGQRRGRKGFGEVGLEPVIRLYGLG